MYVTRFAVYNNQLALTRQIDRKSMTHSDNNQQLCASLSPPTYFAPPVQTTIHQTGCGLTTVVDVLTDTKYRIILNEISKIRTVYRRPPDKS